MKRWISEFWQLQTISDSSPLLSPTCCLLRWLCSPPVHKNSLWEYNRALFCVIIYIYTSDAWVFTSGHFERGGKSKKSWLSSFAGVTWRVVGCIVCWTCFIAFVERLTENTQRGARPWLPEIVSVLVENPEGSTAPNQPQLRFNHQHNADPLSSHLISGPWDLSAATASQGEKSHLFLNSSSSPPMKPHLVLRSTIRQHSKSPPFFVSSFPLCVS